MSKDDLDKYRKLAPFVIFELSAATWFLVSSKSLADAKTASELLAPVIAAIAAFFYVGLGLGRRVWAREISNYVGQQIREGILGMVPSDLSVTEDEKRALGAEVLKELTGIFWEVVDQSTLLVSEKGHFYSNGLTYSTSIDVFLISCFTGLVDWVACLITRTAGFAYAGGILILIGIASRTFVTPALRARHLKLSAQQLDVLNRQESQAVTSKIREIVVGRRKEKAHAAPAAADTEHL